LGKICREPHQGWIFEFSNFRNHDGKVLDNGFGNATAFKTPSNDATTTTPTLDRSIIICSHRHAVTRNLHEGLCEIYRLFSVVRAVVRLVGHLMLVRVRYEQGKVIYTHCDVITSHKLGRCVVQTAIGVVAYEEVTSQQYGTAGSA